MRCLRLEGLSCRGCECRLPNGAGWLACPSRAFVPTRQRVVNSQFTGDVCPDCGGLNMIRSGTCAVCGDCGATTGCS